MDCRVSQFIGEWMNPFSPQFPQKLHNPPYQVAFFACMRGVVVRLSGSDRWIHALRTHCAGHYQPAAQAGEDAGHAAARELRTACRASQQAVHAFADAERETERVEVFRIAGLFVSQIWRQNLFFEWNRRNWWKSCSESPREGRVVRRPKRRFALNGIWIVALFVGERADDRIDR